MSKPCERIKVSSTFVAVYFKAFSVLSYARVRPVATEPLPSSSIPPHLFTFSDLLVLFIRSRVLSCILEPTIPPAFIERLPEPSVSNSVVPILTLFALN